VTNQRSSELDGVVAIIPARFGSSRFPGKPLVPILGVPLIIRVFRQVEEVFPAGKIIVATDDERIRGVCIDAGIAVAMTPSDCLTGTDRVWEAARCLDAVTIINVQGDEPLVKAKDILAVVRARRTHPDHVVNAMCSIHDRKDIESPNVPKVVVNGRNDLVYMSRAPIPHVKSTDSVEVYRRQVCIYGFTRGQLQTFAEYGRKSTLEEPEDIEILRFLDLGIPVRMVEVSEASAAVDVPEDVSRVEQLLERRL
tara:strand:+ start:894 stop:1652 length:759 start_codon:yes stop_codon:yes gene_type:complete